MTKDEFVRAYEPMMVSYYQGGVCRKCGAWVPRIANSNDEYGNYEKHLSWHGSIEPSKEGSVA